MIDIDINISENYSFQKNTLNFEDYCSLRESVEWLNFDDEQMKRGLANSLLTISVSRDGKTVGMGRLIGDGGMYYTIVDVVVRPEHQGKGIGSRIIDLILEYVGDQTPSGGRSSIQLIAERGKEEFYLKKGFKVIPHEFCGSGMRMVIRK